jgi:hypothetical protein
MTDFEMLGQSVQERKRVTEELHALKLRATRLGEILQGMADMLMHRPSVIAFAGVPHSRPAGVVTEVGNFECSKEIISELAETIRVKEDRLKELNRQLEPFKV